MKFFRNVLSTFSAQLLVYVMTFATSVIIARTLGRTGKGTLAALGTISMMAVTFGTFGQNFAATYFAARDKHRRRAIFTNILVQSVFIGIALVFALLVVQRLFPASIGNISARLFTIFIIQVPFLYSTRLIAGFLLGREDITAYNLLGIISPAVSLAGLFVCLAVLHAGVFDAVCVYAAAAIIAAVAHLLFALKNTKPTTERDPNLAGDMLRYGLKIYFNGIFFYLVIQSDILLVNYFLGRAATGVYSITAQFAQILLILPMSAGAVLIPRLTRAPHDEKLKIMRSMSRAMIVVMLLLIGASLAVISPFIKLFFGARFLGAVEPTFILAPGLFLLSSMQVYAYYFSATGLPIQVPILWGLTFVINFVLNIFIIPRYGINGAAFSSTVSYAFIFLAMFLFTKRNTGSRTADLLFLRRTDISEIISIVRSAVQK